MYDTHTLLKLSRQIIIELHNMQHVCCVDDVLKWK